MTELVIVYLNPPKCILFDPSLNLKLRVAESMGVSAWTRKPLTQPSFSQIRLHCQSNEYLFSESGFKILSKVNIPMVRHTYEGRWGGNRTVISRNAASPNVAAPIIGLTLKCGEMPISPALSLPLFLSLACYFFLYVCVCMCVCVCGVLWSPKLK